MALSFMTSLGRLAGLNVTTTGAGLTKSDGTQGIAPFLTQYPYQSAAVITPGTPVTAGRGVFIACTVAGTVRLKLGDGTSTLDVPVNVGPNIIDNIAVVDVVSGSTTATSVVSVLS